MHQRVDHGFVVSSLMPQTVTKDVRSIKLLSAGIFEMFTNYPVTFWDSVALSADSSPNSVARRWIASSNGAMDW